MENNKKTFWHNGAIVNEGTVPSPNGIQVGDRFRVIGEIHADRLYPKLSNEWTDYVVSGSKIDTWAVVDRNIGIMLNAVPVTLESVNGRSVSLYLTDQEWTAFTEKGRQVEQETQTIKQALAQHCYDNNIAPLWSPTQIQDLANNHKINVGEPIVIDGVPRGIVTDCIIENGNIVVTTDTNMITNVNMTNSHRALTLGIQDYLDRGADVKPVHPFEIDAFMNRFKPTFVENFSHYVFTGDITRCRDLMHELGIISSVFLQDRNTNDLAHLHTHDALELVSIMACQVIAHDVIPQALPRPTEQEKQYLQNLGYTEEAMAAKGKILSAWMQEKDLTQPEKIAAMSIVENKVLHVVTDIESGSVKEKKSFLGINIHMHADTLADVFMKGGTVHGTHTNLATGEIETGKIEIPDCSPDKNYLHSYSLLMRNENEMWTNVDAIQAYHDFGGFDYQMALEMSQNGGKGQKVNEPTIAEATQEAEQTTMIDHMNLIDRGR